MEKMYLAAVQMAPGIGGVRAKALTDYFGSAKNAWEAGLDDLVASKALSESLSAGFVRFRQKTDLAKLDANWRRKGICLYSIDDEEYPKLLRNIFNPPHILYSMGVLPKTDKTIAIVGARDASHYGKNTARLFASGLSEQGVWVVSGAARGIDTAAHQGALSTGRTIAVLGTGVDVVYPPENGRLLKEIAEKGAVISEYAPGSPPISGHFPMRNRIISGMSNGVIIVEAGSRSGALITADFAIEEGRDVFAVPGNIFSDKSSGTNKLIKEGAKLVNSLFDILDEYGWGNTPAALKSSSRTHASPPSNPPPELAGDEKIIYDILDDQLPLSLEEIVMKSTLPASACIHALFKLQLNGLVSDVDNQCYIRS